MSRQLKNPAKAHDAVRRMRSLATLLLLLMLAVFLAARLYRELHPWLAGIEAFAEAAMIGAFADWFAVVALFRHPLGLPIPHTAVIPANRERIAASVASFVADNFLHPEAVTEKLNSLEPGRMAAAWLGREENARRLADSLCGVLPPIIHALDDEDVDRFLHENLVRRLEGADIASVLAGGLETVVESGAHQILFDEGLRLSARVLRDNRDFIERTIAGQLAVLRAPIVGEIVCSLLADAILKKAVHGIEAVLSDPAHESRKRFHRVAGQLAAELREDEGVRTRVRNFTKEAVESAFIRNGLPPIWRHLKESLVADLARPGSQTRLRLESGIVRFAEALHADGPLRAKIDTWTRNFVMEEVLPRRAAAREFIEQTVLRWPVEEMTAKIEGQVGRDLQFIRINGTLVGGLVGLLLFLIFR